MPGTGQGKSTAKVSKQLSPYFLPNKFHLYTIPILKLCVYFFTKLCNAVLSKQHYKFPDMQVAITDV